MKKTTRFAFVHNLFYFCCSVNAIFYVYSKAILKKDRKLRPIQSFFLSLFVDVIVNDPVD